MGFENLDMKLTSFLNTNLNQKYDPGSFFFVYSFWGTDHKGRLFFDYFLCSSFSGLLAFDCFFTATLAYFARKKSVPPFTSLRSPPICFLAKHSLRYFWLVKKASRQSGKPLRRCLMVKKSLTTQWIKSFRENKNLFCSFCKETRKHFIYKIRL